MLFHPSPFSLFLAGAVRDAESASEAAERRCEQRDADLDRAREETKREATERSRAEESLAALRRRLEETRHALDDARQTTADGERRVRDLERDLAQASDDRNELNRQLTAARAQLDSSAPVGFAMSGPLMAAPAAATMGTPVKAAAGGAGGLSSAEAADLQQTVVSLRARLRQAEEEADADARRARREIGDLRDELDRVQVSARRVSIMTCGSNEMWVLPGTVLISLLFHPNPPL